MKYRYFFAVTVLFLALSCASSKEDFFRLSLPHFPSSYNPYFQREKFSSLILNAIYEPLYMKIANKFEPKIASGWSFPDSNHIKLEIAKNRRFHNGEELTAEDVAASIKFYKYFSSELVYDSLNVDSDYELSIYAKDPKSFFVKLENIYIFSSNLLSKDLQWNIERAVGTGPYYLTSSGDEKIVLSKFHFYPDNKDFLDRIDIYKIKSVENIVKKFMEGELDFLDNPAPELMGNRVAEQEYFKDSKITSSIMFLSFDSLRENIPNFSYNPFADLKLREMISSSINVERFISEKIDNNGFVAESFIPEISYPIPENEKREYSLEKIRSYIEENHPELLKNTIAIDCISGKFYGDVAIANYVKEELATIGIQVKINFVETKKLYLNIKTKKSYAYLTGYSFLGGEVYKLIEYFFERKKNDSTKIGYQFFDDYIHEALKELKRTKDEEEYNRKLDLLINYCDDLYRVIPLYAPYDVLYFNKKFIYEKSESFDLKRVKRK